MGSFRTLDDLDVAGKRVLVRLDLNVPMKNGEVTDSTRIDRQAPTIRELAEKGARVIVLSHFERPGGKVVPELSLKPIAPALSRAIGWPVSFAPDCIGPVAAAAVENLNNGDVLLLENTRFHPGEEKNDPAFARELASLGDIFVNDAFSTAHRAHASTEGIAHILPAAAGRSMHAELSHLERATEKPERPLMAVAGGAKISSKITLLENLTARVDVLVIGGAMANTFLAAQGLPIGRSLTENNQLDVAKRCIAAAQSRGVRLLLPIDVVVARDFRANASSRIVAASQVEEDEMILDVGPRSIQAFVRELNRVKTVLWNGPLGAFEVPPFDRGTNAAAKAVAERTTEGKLLSVAGGGDTVAALVHAGVEGTFSYVSTAGGAFLEWLEGRTLPGVAVLERNQDVLLKSMPADAQLMRARMNKNQLIKTAQAMVAKGKGILAADESSGTIKRRFDAIGVESSETNRRDYREMLFRSVQAMKSNISGVILYDETIRQHAKDGAPLVQLIVQTGSLPGIKVDKGTKPLPFCPGEVITEGLDGLDERLEEYKKLGARFAKWRAVIDIGTGIPTYTAISSNSHALARYAAICQDHDIVPIVEPEVLMDGGHGIDQCSAVTEWMLKTVFSDLYHQRVMLECMVLKPNMVISGKKSATPAGPEEVAEKTVAVLKRCVPPAVAGIAFLSGGQSDEEATLHLNLINQMGPLPWPVTFSYGRALQHEPQKLWAGKPENVAAAQRAFAHRARMNGLAAQGDWKRDLERAA